MSKPVEKLQMRKGDVLITVPAKWREGREKMGYVVVQPPASQEPKAEKPVKG